MHNALFFCFTVYIRTMRIVILLILFALSVNSNAQIKVKVENDSIIPPSNFSNFLASSGIKQITSEFVGNPSSIGFFTNGITSIGFDSGIVLTTGLAEQVVGPNSRANAGANFSNHFFSDGDIPLPTGLCDGVSLTIDFIANRDSVCLDYVFGSEEYPEFVAKEYGDMVGIYIYPLNQKTNKFKNLAILPDKSPVHINYLNANKNAGWFVRNDDHSCENYHEIELDGYSKPLFAGCKVKPGIPYRLKIILADAGDCEYDSGIFLRAVSFKTATKPLKKKKSAVKSASYVVEFPYNESILSEESMLHLIKHMDLMRNRTFDSIQITGHTEPFGLEKNNMHLGLERAKTIDNLLITYGVKAVKTKTTTKGSARPLSKNKDKTSRALNRRVEIIYY